MAVRTSLELGISGYSLVLVLLHCAGCGAVSNEAEDGPSAGALLPIEEAQQGPESNGIALNGLFPNGIALNGPSPNAIALNGIALNGIALNGIALNGVHVEGGELVAVVPDCGTTLRGAALTGATLAALLGDGSSVPLRIDAVEGSGDAEVFLYRVSFHDGKSWRAACGEEKGEPIPAMALRGIWDPSSGTASGGDFIDDPGLFTFACTNAVLAKCVRIGYAPWREVEECHEGVCQSIPMRAFHQSCTRMMRADYCGDGTPHTKNGTPIDVWDGFAIQLWQDIDHRWQEDAEWSPEGAVCISGTRWDGQVDAYIDEHCPERRASAFACFGEASTFFSAQGFGVSLTERSLLRNESTHARSVLH